MSSATTIKPSKNFSIHRCSPLTINPITHNLAHSYLSNIPKC